MRGNPPQSPSDSAFTPRTPSEALQSTSMSGVVSEIMLEPLEEGDPGRNQFTVQLIPPKLTVNRGERGVKGVKGSGAENVKKHRTHLSIASGIFQGV